MAERGQLREPWLVAAWPGMGSVALVAGTYLVQHLPARKVHEMDLHDFFDVQSVDVDEGVAAASPLPRGMFFECRVPRAGRDLLIFLGEAQPPARGYSLCEQVVEYAARRGVKRIFTFAAIATQLHPGTPPHAFAVASDKESLEEATAFGVEVLKNGKVSGLNGLLLAAAADRGVPAVCLLGELPYFAVEVPNPGAAKAVLERFTEIAGIDIDLAPLGRQAHALEEHLLRLLEQLEASGEAAGADVSEGEADEEDEFRPLVRDDPADANVLEPGVRQRIEALFDKARQDRAKAVELKQELDRLGVFKQYEDQFLDLFRHGG